MTLKYCAVLIWLARRGASKPLVTANLYAAELFEGMMFKASQIGTFAVAYKLRQGYDHMAKFFGTGGGSMPRKIEDANGFFKVEDYQKRLRIVRVILTDGNANELARRVGISEKRWGNYERGYPVPREIAWKLWKLGISTEWLWYGAMGNLSPDWKKKIEAVERVEQKHLTLSRQFEAMKQEMRRVDEERRKVVQSLSESGKRSKPRASV